MHIVEKAGSQSADSAFTFVLSNEDVDRMGDVVVQNGINLVQFKKNPVALFAHQQRFPIGTWENIRRDGESLLADLKLAARGTSRMIDELRSLLEQRILRAASIGFGVNKSEPIDPDRPYGPQRFTKTELLEASLVAVPANPSALVVRDLSDESRALFFTGTETRQSAGRLASPPADSALQSDVATRRTLMNPSLSDKIKAARERLVAIDARAKELETIAQSVDTLTDEQTAEVTNLADERATVEKNVANLTQLEKLIGERAQPAVGTSVIVRRDNAHRDEPKGTVITRLALAHVLAYLERRPVVDVARDHFAHDQRVEAIIKNAVAVADTTTAGWAKELVRQDVQGWIEGLVPVSVYAAVATRGLIINFGDAGSVSVPYRAGGAGIDLAGAFVGENGVIPVHRTTLAAQVLNRYKMGVITTITKELSRTSNPQAEALLRRLMETDTAQALDRAFLDANPQVPGTRPAGILNGVAAIAASAAATPIEKALADLKGMVNAMTAAGNGVRPVFLMNPAQKLALSTMYSAGLFVFQDEVNGNRLMGGEIVASVNVPVGDVILIDAAHLATGLGTPEFDVSDTATLVMADSGAAAPTHATAPADRTIVGTAGQVPQDGGISVYDPAQHAAGKVGEAAVAISLFQQWAIGLRTVLPVSWGVMRAGSVQWVDNVTW